MLVSAILHSSDHKDNKIVLNNNKFVTTTATFYDIFRKVSYYHHNGIWCSYRRSEIAERLWRSALALCRARSFETFEYLVKLRKAVIIKSDSLSYDKNKTLRFTA